ncbi:MAG: tRNA 2-thiocytidine(32) synthetase TtcA [Desulfomonile tiedjei]|nr:tRNA 2-thiocytidine(32) synthetase TtcA [Desulfomonile tiedjei]
MKNTALKRLTRLVGRGIGDFGLIQDQDRVLVALSGGKDSWSLLYALRDLQRKAPVKFDLAAVTIHPGQVEFDCRPLSERLSQDGIAHWVVQGNIVELVDEKLTEGTNPCSFCSRLRRGMLYTFATKTEWNKIALGHHTDDFVETLLLNLFFNGSIKGMSPNLLADDGRNRVIRPMVYVREELTRECAAQLGVPILGCYCNCRGMKGARRQWVKALLSKIEKDVPGVYSSILGSMARVHHRHLLTAWKQAARNPTLLNEEEGVD